MKVIIISVPDTTDISAFNPSIQVNVVAGTVTITGTVQLVGTAANPDTTVAPHVHGVPASVTTTPQ